MRKLITANFFRFRKDRFSWCVVGIIVILSLVNVFNSARSCEAMASSGYIMGLEDYYFNQAPLIGAFPALLISAVLFGMIEPLEMGVSEFVGCIFVAIVFAVSFAALYTVIGSLFSNKAMTIIYTFAVFVVFAIAASGLYDRLCEPEMNEGMMLVGTQLVEMEPTPNPLYLSGTIRTVCEVALEFLPTGQALLLSDVAIDYPIRAIALSVVFTTVTLFVGSMLFRRKDIK